MTHCLKKDKELLLGEVTQHLSLHSESYWSIAQLDANLGYKDHTTNKKNSLSLNLQILQPNPFTLFYIQETESWEITVA